MDKEQKWRALRLGKITASELGSITSASGKIIDGCLDYIRSKRFERTHGFALPVSSRAMEIGKEQEPYAIAWYRQFFRDDELIYSQELSEIPFWTNQFVPNFGASPDAFSPDETLVVEIKCTVGNSIIEFFFDQDTSYTEKKARVAKEHLDQILGQFISNERVQRVRLVKYCPQNDDIPLDLDGPLEPWRGIVFDFDRIDYEDSISEMVDRINLFNAFIDSRINPSDFKKGDWSVDENGNLCKK